MRFIQSDITFFELVNIALETSHWQETCDNLSIHYLHRNGHVFSLAAIEDDSDIKCMLTLANHNTNGIYLYINRRSIGFAKHIGEQRRSFGMDMRFLRGKQTDYSGSIHNVKCKVPPVESHENSTVNLCEDDDIHFSAEQNIASDELAKESYCVLVDCVVVVNMPDDRQFITIESGNTGTNLAGNSSVRGKRPPM